VEDGAARRFMESFYGALRRGADRATALQRARADLAHAGYPHRDRSAFVLAGVGGETVPILADAKEPGPKTRLLWIALVGALLGMALGLLRRRRTGADA